MDKELLARLERAVDNNQTMMATTFLLEAVKELDERLSKCTCGEKKPAVKRTKTTKTADANNED